MSYSSADRGRGVAGWILWEADAQTESEGIWEESLWRKRVRERQSKSSNCGVGLTPVKGEGKAGCLGSKRPRGYSSEEVWARLKGLTDCHGGVLYWPEVVSTCATPHSVRGWGGRVRHVPKPSCEAALLVTVSLEAVAPLHKCHRDSRLLELHGS